MLRDSDGTNARAADASKMALKVPAATFMMMMVVLLLLLQWVFFGYSMGRLGWLSKMENT
jgi:hypothetical protein